MILSSDKVFNNPVIYTDLPDPDVIFVDDTYYMVNTSMFYFPGVTLLESKNLVNWRIASNAVDEFCPGNPHYDLTDKKNAYARGQWATSLSYFKGKFHLLFSDLLQYKSYVSVSDTPYGPWQLRELSHFYYDSDILYDENSDKIYLVYGVHNIHMAVLDPNTFNQLDNYPIFENEHQEGNRISHIGDYYYVYSSYGFPASQLCIRSRSLQKDAHWEMKEVFKGEACWQERMIHQASLIQTRNGEYWAMAFNDRDGFGRVPFLMPVTFVENWPMIDPYNTTGFMCYTVPDNTTCDYELQTSDEFASAVLKSQWQFNHNAAKDHYSLTDNPDHLRLKTYNIVDSLYYARNTITQRISGPVSCATSKINISKMNIGDVAGLAVFAWPYSSIAIERKIDGFYIQYRYFDTVIEEKKTFCKEIYLRSDVDAATLTAGFYYSTDNDSFTQIGEEFYIKQDIDKCFVGCRFALFNYATNSLGGYIDIDWFRVDTPINSYNYSSAYNRIDAERYDYNYNNKLVYAYEDPDNYNHYVSTGNAGYSWLGYNEINFGKHSPDKIKIRYSAENEKTSLVIRKDSLTGEIISTINLHAMYMDQAVSFDIKSNSISGLTKLYLEFISTDNNILNLDYFQFISGSYNSLEKNYSQQTDFIYSNGILYFQNHKHTRYAIYSIDGRMLIKDEITTNSIDISFLPHGIYIIKTDFGNKPIIIR